MNRTPASELNPPVSFKKAFKPILELAELVFNGHAKEKGDSWINCDIKFLEEKLQKEIKEYNDSFVSKFEESLDVINVALMIAMRKFLEKYNILNWPYVKLKGEPTKEDCDNCFGAEKYHHCIYFTKDNKCIKEEIILNDNQK